MFLNEFSDTTIHLPDVNDTTLDDYTLKIMQIQIVSETYRISDSDENAIILHKSLHYIIFLLSIIYFRFSPSIISLSFVFLMIICLITRNILYLFNNTIHQKHTWFLLLSFFSEILSWVSFVYAMYFMSSFKSILLPGKIIASSKQDWEDYYGHVLTYDHIKWFHIVFIPLLFLLLFIFTILGLSLSHEGINYTSRHLEINFDRSLVSMLIIQSLFIASLCFLSKINVLLKCNSLKIVSQVALALSLMEIPLCYYIGRKRKKHKKANVIDHHAFLFSILITIIYFMLFLIILFFQKQLYCLNMSLFSANYHSYFIKQYTSENKYYFKGDYNKMTECPKDLTVVNWEDSENLFGCLNLKGYFKIKIMIGLVLDIAQIVFLVRSFCLLICYIDSDQIPKYSLEVSVFYLSKAETIIYNIGKIIWCSVIVFIIIFHYQSYLLNNQFESISLLPFEPNDSLDITQPLYSPSDKSKEYYLIYESMSNDPNQSTTSYYNYHDVLTNILQSNKVSFNYSFNTPIEYVISIQNKTIENTTIGVILTNTLINIGKLALIINQVKSKGRIEGCIYKATQLTKGVKYVNVYVVEGYYYPLTEQELLNNKKNFKPSKYLHQTSASSDGSYYFEDISVGQYSIIAYKNNYYIEISYITLTDENNSLQIPFYLTEIKEDSQLIVVVERFQGLPSFDLSVQLSLNSQRKCIVGYMNKQCENVFWNKKNDFKNKMIREEIKIEIIQMYQYDFFIHKYNSNNDGFKKKKFAFNLEEEDYENDEKPILKNHPRVKMYIPKFKFALLNKLYLTHSQNNIWKIFQI